MLSAMIELTISPSFSLSALQAFLFEQFACVITSSISYDAVSKFDVRHCFVKLTFCSSPLSSISPSSSSSSSSFLFSTAAGALPFPGAVSPAAFVAAFCCSAAASC